MEQEVMQAIRAELESNIDAKYREFHSSLVPGQNCRILGVRILVSRRIAKATARDHYEVYTEQFNPEVYEELLIRGMMIGYGKLQTKKVGGWSDSCLAAAEGVPVVCAMGVKGANNHSMEEYAVAETLFSRAKLALASIITF